MTLAKISLSIVFISILFHSVKWVPTIIEFVDPKNYIEQLRNPNSWIHPFEHTSHLLLVFNSSIHFYIYYITHSKWANRFSRWTVEKVQDIRETYSRQSSVVVSHDNFPSSINGRTMTQTMTDEEEHNEDNSVVTKPMLPSRHDVRIVNRSK